MPVPGGDQHDARSAARAVPLRLDVSTRPDFSTLVASVPLRALAIYDFTVRAKVAALSPKTTYHYRFVAGGDVSTTGVARTAPEAGEANERVRFAWLTCQDWSVNHWQAMTLMAAERDLDFVVHVGDYIYETVGTSPPARPSRHILRCICPTASGSRTAARMPIRSTTTGRSIAPIVPIRACRHCTSACR